MKLLTLVRHAKSDWDNDLPDFDRPLNKRGETDAPIMGKIANDRLPMADIMFTSPALRAYSTACVFAKELNYPLNKLMLKNSLYHCGASDYLDILENINPDINHVYIFSHNPGTTHFVNFLCNENIYNIPTCGVAHIKLDIKLWSEITRDSGELNSLLIPKMFK